MDNIIKKLLNSDSIILLDPEGLYRMCHVDLNRSDSKLVKIQEVTPGTTICFAGILMEVLDTAYPSANGGTGVFCLSKNILFHKAFDDNSNNWKESNLRKYLNGEFYEDLTKRIDKNCILPFKRDLLTEDGLKDYGTCVDNISLISCNEYREYREYIRNKEVWWTLTAYSSDAFYPYYTRIVIADGALESYAIYRECSGVAPVLLLLPSARVGIVNFE